MYLMVLPRGETSLKQGPVINQVQEKLTLDQIILVNNNAYHREIPIHLMFKNSL